MHGELMTLVDKGRGQCDAATCQEMLSTLLITDGSWEERGFLSRTLEEQ